MLHHEHEDNKNVTQISSSVLSDSTKGSSIAQVSLSNQMLVSPHRDMSATNLDDNGHMAVMELDDNKYIPAGQELSTQRLPVSRLDPMDTMNDTLPPATSELSGEAWAFKALQGSFTADEYLAHVDAINQKLELEGVSYTYTGFLGLRGKVSDEQRVLMMKVIWHDLARLMDCDLPKDEITRGLWKFMEQLARERT